MRKALLFTTLLLTACTPATAQLKVVAPQSVTCLPASTLTPVLGIVVPSYLDGEDGFSRSDYVTEALEDVGFRVYDQYGYKLIDKATVKIDGRILNWRNSSGDVSERIGDVRLTVSDLASGEPLFIIQQSATKAIFGAPRWNSFLQGLVSTVRQKLCQVPTND